MPNVASPRRLLSFLHGSLRARLFIPIAVLAAAAMGTMGWAAVQIHGADMERASFERAALFAKLATQGFEAHMLEGRTRDLSGLLTVIKDHRPEIEAVSLLGTSGEIRYSSDPALVGLTPWPVAQMLRNQPLHQGDSYSVSRALPNEPRCMPCHGARSELTGWLMLRVSTAPIQAAKQRLSSALLTALVPSLFLLLGTAYWLLGHEAIWPIQRLVAAMRRAEAGEPNVKAADGRPDEIGAAAGMFDATLLALRRSQAEVEKTYELRMIRADRFAMVGQMATGLAHEIKNPLAGLSGALELLAEDFRQTRHGEIIGEMRHQVDRLGSIMDGLLSFARPPKALLRQTSVNAALKKVLFLITQQRKGAAVEVRPELDPSLPWVEADPGQLEQVFLNICMNAFQALNGSGGTITVRSGVTEGAVLVEIADSGPGIPSEIQPHIFTPFFTTRPQGTGLGLAICARLISEHGGAIDFECPPEGGATFWIRLPVSGQVLLVPPPESERQAVA